MHTCICRPEMQMCLSNMAAQRGDEDSDSKKWLQMVDHGGLFKVSDNAFALFVKLEMKLRYHLLNVFNENSESLKEVVVKSLILLIILHPSTCSQIPSNCQPHLNNLLQQGSRCFIV